MAYTRPSAGTANATFLGATGYTRPAAGSANATFVQGSTFSATTAGASTYFGAPTATWGQLGSGSGFITVQLGLPTTGLTQPATGTNDTSFGSPLGANLQRAEGFLSPQAFGSPRLFPYHSGTWPSTTSFGAPTAQQYWRGAAGWPTARFGTPTTPTPRSLSAAGRAASKAGHPIALRYLPPGLSRTARASGRRRTRFGTPWGAPQQLGFAASFSPAAAGTPKVRRSQPAYSLPPSAQFGTPEGVSRITYHLHGFRRTRLGTPTATRTA